MSNFIPEYNEKLCQWVILYLYLCFSGYQSCLGLDSVVVGIWKDFFSLVTACLIKLVNNIGLFSITEWKSNPLLLYSNRKICILQIKVDILQHNLGLLINLIWGYWYFRSHLAAFQVYPNFGSCPFGLYVFFTRNLRNIRPSERTKIGYTSFQFSSKLDTSLLLIWSVGYTSVHASMARLNTQQVAEEPTDGQRVYFG